MILTRPGQKCQRALKGLFFLLFLLSSAKTCGQGCLRCNSTLNKCEVCDNVTNFFNDLNGGCVQISIQNCLQLKSNGKCNQCAADFKPNIRGDECLELARGEVVDNCSTYDSEANCTECAQGYFQYKGSCRLVLVPIPDCQVHTPESPDTCIKCAPGKLLSKDGSSCESLPDRDHCAAYNHFDCFDCTKGYYFNANAYITRLLAQDEAMNQYLYDVDTENFNLRMSAFCEAEEVKNCRVFLSQSSCLFCEDGFFRDPNGLCMSAPREPLDGCLDYRTESICERCVEGRFLQNNKCKNITLVEKCLKYATTSNECIECDVKHFLSGPRTCASRVESLSENHCKEPNLQNDRCISCENDYFVDHLGRCIEGISDCDVHSYNNGQLECQQCLEAHFFDAQNNRCERPLDFATNPCLRFGNSRGECRECKPGFYLDGQCRPHQNLDANCEVASGTNANKCSACANGFSLFENSRVCTKVTVANPNCLKWRSATECEQCAPFFQAPNCEQIPADENCEFKHEGATECAKCRSGYFQNDSTQNKCVTGLDFERYKCETFSLANSSTLVQCDTCVKGAFFMEIQDFFGCMNRSNYSSFPDCQMLVYDTDSGQPECVKCIRGKFLQDGQCVDQCSTDYIRTRTVMTVDTALENQLTVEAVDSCRPRETAENCKILVPSVDSTTGQLVCAECEEGFARVYDITKSNTTFNYNSQQDHYDDLIARNAPFACRTLDMISEYSAAHCKAFAETSTGKHGCLKCQLGYTGYVKKPFEDEDLFVIQECVLLDECNRLNTNMLGLSTFESLTKWKVPIETFVSCLECVGQNMMPVIFLRQKQDQSLSPIWFNVLNFVTNQTPNTEVDNLNAFGAVSNCLPTTIGSKFGYPEDFKVTFPSNCALLLYRIDREPKTDLLANEPTIYCIACAPGYRVAERGAIDEDIDVVRKCEPIEYCRVSSWYNYCSECLDGSVYRFDPDTKLVQFDHCVMPTKPNCHAALVNGDCAVCLPGFSINDEGFCEDLNFANCSGSTFLSRSPVFGGTHTAPDYFDLSLGLFLHGRSNIGSRRYGCSQCEQDFIAVRGLPSLGHCVQSSYVQGGKFNRLAFIDNCLQFGWDYAERTHVCRKCIPGFMPNFSGSQCVRKLDYCLRGSANGNVFCHLCQSGFTLLDGRCVLNDIKNCLDFAVSNGALFCSHCADGYYLYGGKFCFKGKVDYCLQYANNQPAKCLKCAHEHAVFRTQLGETVCVPFPEQNCKFWDPLASNGRFECAECENGFYTTDVSADSKTELCFGPLTIEHCAKIDVNLDSADLLNFKCVTCETGYYRADSDSACLLLDKVDLCSEYSTESNRCLQCEDAHYLDYAGKTCTAIPAGIFGCQLYRSTDECRQCKPNMYLFDNSCHFVDPLDWIDHCELYSSVDQCLQCQSGYFLLEKNKCFATRAVKCLTYSDIDTCESCPPGYGFMTDGTLTNCVLINIANCKKPTTHYPFSCIICKKGFYESSGSCHPTDKVPNCEYYQGQNVCLRCKLGYSRSLDGSSCTSVSKLLFPVDNQCDFSVFSPKKTCVACSPGYFFAEGLCKRCSTGYGCMFCDPNNPKKCLVCAPGTVMSLQGKCEGTPLSNFDFGKAVSNQKTVSDLRPNLIIKPSNSLVLFLTAALFW